MHTHPPGPSDHIRHGHIVMIPHARTAWADDGRHASSTELVLSADGELEARELGIALRRREFARVLSSPRRHVVQSAELAGFGPVLQTDDDLAEWDFGLYEGLTPAEIDVRHGGAWNLWRDGIPVGPGPGSGPGPGPGPGETAEAVHRRAGAVLDRLREALEAGEDVLLFSHREIMRAIALAWTGIPSHLGTALDLASSTVSELGFRHGERTIIHWNAPTRDWPERLPDPVHQWYL